MTDTKLSQLIINECSEVPETFEPNQLYLTPDTTDKDIAEALKQAKEYTDEALNGKQDIIPDLEIIRMGANKGATAVQPSTLNDYAKKTDIPVIPTKVSAFENDKGYLTEHQSLADYAKKTDIPSKISAFENDKGYLTQHQSLDAYALKSQLPTKTSQLTNDSGFLTEHQDISGLATKSEVQEVEEKIPDVSGFATKTELSGKQDTISDLDVIRSNASKGASAVQPNQLSTVATSGSYNDLANKPTIPTTPSQVGALPDTTKYGSSLSYSDDKLQLLDQDGNALGSSIKIEASGGGGSSNDIFDHKWSDHILDDMSWLRADTFSWQSGEVYKSAYEHLVSDLGETTSEATFYGWEYRGDVIYTKTDSPYDGVTHYYDGNGNLLGTIESYNPPFLLAGGTAYDRDSSYDFTGPSTSYSATQKTETIGSNTITYYLAEDGHKIVLPDQESAVQAIYNETGVAWYYILDVANKRFKLPRELPITDKSKGNGSPFGIKIGANECNLAKATSSSVGGAGYIYPTVSGLPTATAIQVSGDESKSGIISHRANENGQQYLYFYVGQFSKTATEQTAGIIAETLNGKADLDLSNTTVPHLVEVYSNGTSWYRVYSDGWCEQGGIIPASTSNISFLIKMSDANYTSQISGYKRTDTATLSWNYISANTQTATGFTIVSSGGTRSWEVKGYKA